jgi:PPOX class probable F420-dependent enzyme
MAEGETTMLDLTTVRDRNIDRRLREDPIVWLSTVTPDGKPHTLPIWFWWDGETLLMFSQPKTGKVRNLRANPVVTIALETRDEGEEVAFFDGLAELPPQPAGELMSEEYKQKYAHLFPRIDSNPDKMAAEFSQSIRVRLTRIFSWNMDKE